MDTARRGNYNSGEDFVLEYGEVALTFNEADFRERCEQAAVRLGFIGDRLAEPELEDLVNLAVNGEILDPPRRSATTSTTAGPRSSARLSARSCTGCAASSSAAPGSTSECARASSTSPSTSTPTLRLRPAGPRRRADRARPRALLGPGRIPRPRRLASLAAGCGLTHIRVRRSRATARRLFAAVVLRFVGRGAARFAGCPGPRGCGGWRRGGCGGAGLRTRAGLAAAGGASSSGRSVPLAAGSSEGNSPSVSSAIRVVSPPIGARAVAITVSEPAPRRLRAEAIVRRAAFAPSPSSVSIASTELPPRSAIRRARSAACSTAASWASLEAANDSPLEVAWSSACIRSAPPGAHRRRAARHRGRRSPRAPRRPAAAARFGRSAALRRSARASRAERRQRSQAAGVAEHERLAREVDVNLVDPRADDGLLAATPLIVSIRISDAWRSERRAARTGPLIRSPETSSQRRACAAEM